MGRKRERGEEKRGGGEESEFAQAPDSRGSQLLKRTKLVRLFFQQGENIALQKLDANSNLILVCATTCGPFAEWKIPFCQPPSSLPPLVSLSLGSKFASARLRAASVTNKTENCRPPNHLTGFDLSLFQFWQVQDDLLFVPPQSPHPALRRSEEER